MKPRGVAKRMRRLLRDKSRMAFFKNGEWTKYPDEATDFNDMNDMLEICELYGVNDAELVVHFSSGDDLAVPVG